MPVSIALVGPTGVGKSTLFKALTSGRGKDGVGMVDVPDARLGRLAAAVQPKKIVPAQLRLVDAPPGSRAQRIAAAREADVLLELVRCFGPDPSPTKDLEEVELDLVLTDLASVERRLELVQREARAGKKEAAAEAEVLALAKAHLDASAPLRDLDLSDEQRSLLTPLYAVTLKPVVSVANVGEEVLAGGGSQLDGLARAFPERELLVVSARLEAELAELDQDEAAEYRRSFGVETSGLESVARAAWHAGGLITFFTAGEPEVRAWPVAASAPAPVAAGVIHSDFEKSFIRAEVTSVEELVDAGSMDALRAAGRLRVEGRDYRVQDGDVMFFRVGK